MNSTHVAAGIGGAIGLQQLTTLLTGWNGLSPDRAAAAAWLILAVLTAAYALLAWFISWKWPSLPPLPEQNAAEAPPAPAAPAPH